MKDLNVIPTEAELDQGAIRLGMPSNGRLAESAMNLFSAAELPLRRRVNDVRCTVGFSARSYDALRVRFMRHDDLVVFTQSADLDAAVTAQDLVAEYGGDNVDEYLPLDFGQCSLVLAVPEDSDVDSVDKLHGRRIATSYPEITRRFCAEHNVSDVGILSVRGSSEGYPLVGVVDAIVDASETGESLRKNGLVVLATIMETRAVFIASKKLNDAQRDNVDFIRDSLNGAMLARMYTKAICEIPNDPESLDRFRKFVEFYTHPDRQYFLDGKVTQVSQNSDHVRFEFMCLDGQISKMMKVLTQGRHVKHHPNDTTLSGVPDATYQLCKVSMIYRKK